MHDHEDNSNSNEDWGGNGDWQEGLSIRVSDITGKSAFTPQDGQRLYELLYPLLKQRQQVTLDFTGVTAMTSVFLNFSVGHLTSHFDVYKQIEFVGLDKFQQALVDRVLENAVQFYSEAS